ncbi:MAG TPA: hypothetical protein VK928_09065 [Longimicrobiales bacterium]|nr:hypothetical protein [Longimicrobiales bacterium]
MHSSARLNDQQLAETLEELRTIAADLDAPAADSYCEAIVELECEALRRGLVLPGPREIMPPAVALRRFHDALARCDLEAAMNPMWHLDGAGLWVAFRLARDLRHPGARMILLAEMVICVGWFLNGEVRGRERVFALMNSPMNDEDREAYLEQWITGLFNFSSSRWGKPF